MCKWGQSKEHVYLTIEKSENDNASCTFEDNKLKISFKNKDIVFDLYAPIDNDKTRLNEKPNQLFIVLEKLKEEEWPRLFSDTLKRLWLKIDWNHWIIDDEQEDNSMGSVPPGFDMNAISGMGGMPDMGDMLEEDKEEVDGDDDDEEDGEDGEDGEDREDGEDEEDGEM